MRTFLLLLCASTIGCVHAMRVDVQNDPLIHQASGRGVWILVATPEGEDLGDSMTGRAIIAAAQEWLAKRGFAVVESKRAADTVLSFFASSKNKDIYVPAHSSSAPVFGANNTYGTAFGSHGAGNFSATTFGVVGTSASYTEGHSETVADRHLILHVWKQEHDQYPVELTRGEARPVHYGDPFFEDQSIVADAVSLLLEKSIMSVKPAKPKSYAYALPGCRARLGIVWGKEFSIARFEAQSQAPAAGLQVGDRVLSILGSAPQGKHQMHEGQQVDIVYERAGVQSQATVPAVEICEGD